MLNTSQSTAKGHVGMLPSLYGTFTQNEDVMTSNKYLKYNHLTKALRLRAYMCGRFDLKPLFLGKLSRLRTNQNFATELDLAIVAKRSFKNCVYFIYVLFNLNIQANTRLAPSM